MTLPINQDLPFDESRIAQGGEELVEFMREYTNYLDDGYRQSVTNIDGNITDYTPIVSGSAVAGDGTYTRQFGQTLRQGIRTTVWFNVVWTNHTGNGEILVSLPYEVARGGVETNWAFNGLLETSGITYPAGTTSPFIKAIPGEFYARPAASGTAINAAFITLGNTGVLIGNVFYLGQDNT